MKKTDKKGFTIAELCVVLAIVAIVSAMVVSFSVLLSARTRESSARLDAMNDLELVESAAEGWLSRMGLEGAVVSQNGSGLTATVTDGAGTSSTYTLSVYGNMLTGTLPGNEVMTVVLEQVNDIDFTILQNAGDTLCICTVTDSEGNTHTVCVNPHVGDTYSAVTSEGGGQT